MSRSHISRPGPSPVEEKRLPSSAGPPCLEVVLKADATGSVEAVTHLVAELHMPGVEIRIIESGVGDVSKSDVLMATTGSRLVIGFAVGIGPRAEDHAREQGVEIRLYRVIYDLAQELEEIARSLTPRTAQERITGQAEVIALFKSTRKGIILGCAVRKGSLSVGKNFRVIDSAGPVYEGIVSSLHVGQETVREARVGQHVGLKILDFQKARVGDLVECFETLSASEPAPWSPRGGVACQPT